MSTVHILRLVDLLLRDLIAQIPQLHIGVDAADILELTEIEADDERLLAQSLVMHHLHQRVDALVVVAARLNLDLRTACRTDEQIEVFLERRDLQLAVLEQSGAAPDVVLEKLLVGRILDHGFAVVPLADVVIVTDDPHAVLGQMHVRLRGVKALFDRQTERRQRVFRSLRFNAAVRGEIDRIVRGRNAPLRHGRHGQNAEDHQIDGSEQKSQNLLKKLFHLFIPPTPLP